MGVGAAKHRRPQARPIPDRQGFVRVGKDFPEAWSDDQRASRVRNRTSPVDDHVIRKYHHPQWTSGCQNAESNGSKKKSKPHIIDEDPEGKDLLALDHLEEAMKFAAILVRHAPTRISAWALQYDVSIRRGKMLLAMQVRVVLLLFRLFGISCQNINSSSR